MATRGTTPVTRRTVEDLSKLLDRVLEQHVGPALGKLAARDRAGDTGMLVVGELRMLARLALEDLERANGERLSPQFMEAAARLTACGLLMLAARAATLEEHGRAG